MPPDLRPLGDGDGLSQRLEWLGEIFGRFERAADPVRSRALIALTHTETDLGSLIVSLQLLRTGIGQARAKGDDPSQTRMATLGTLRQIGRDIDAVVRRLEGGE